GNSPLATVRGYLRDAYNSGWSGGEITSSSAAAAAATNSKTALGYAEKSELPGIFTVADKDSDNSSLIVKYALAGDANLDGRVNALDFNAMASNYGQSAKNWAQGNFNYDASDSVDSTDFTALS